MINTKKESMVTQVKNCVVNLDDMTVIETTKDGDTEYNLIEEVLRQWHGVKGVTIKINKDVSEDM